MDAHHLALDFEDDPHPAAPPGPLTLSEVAAYVHGAIEELDRALQPLRFIAEVAEFRTHPSGHTYFTLTEIRDGETLAEMRAMLWATDQAVLRDFERATGQPVGKGQQLLFAGRLRFHPKFGLSINISEIDPAYTLGNLAMQRAQTLNLLTNEGLIDRNASLPIPSVIQRVAVVSSATAAGYEDFLSQLIQNPAGYTFEVDLFQATVQGDGAPESIAAALARIDPARFDAVALIRGGGGKLDLAAFDDLKVGRAVALCPLPVITGIGHERDESVADIVAAVYGKTPTAVAEWIIQRAAGFEAGLDRAAMVLYDVPAALKALDVRLQRSSGEFIRLTDAACTRERDRLRDAAETLTSGVLQRAMSAAARLDVLAARLRERPAGIAHAGQVSLADVSARLHLHALGHLRECRASLDAGAKLIATLGPEPTLRRGFSITRYGAHALVTSEGVAPGAVLTTQLYEGSIESTVTRSGKAI